MLYLQHIEKQFYGHERLIFEANVQKKIDDNARLFISRINDIKIN